jgi:type IV pilus assembly protein PilC
MDVVRFYREEVNRGITNLLNILEPILIVILGVIVALIMASVLLPLYQTAAL